MKVTMIKTTLFSKVICFNYHHDIETTLSNHFVRPFQINDIVFQIGKCIELTPLREYFVLTNNSPESMCLMKKVIQYS